MRLIVKLDIPMQSGLLFCAMVPAKVGRADRRVVLVADSEDHRLESAVTNSSVSESRLRHDVMNIYP